MLDFVMGCLNRPGVSITQVCADTGLKRSWMWQLKDGRIPDPSVRRIQLLHDYFSARADAGSTPPAAIAHA